MLGAAAGAAAGVVVLAVLVGVVATGFIEAPFTNSTVRYCEPGTCDPVSVTSLALAMSGFNIATRLASVAFLT